MRLLTIIVLQIPSEEIVETFFDSVDEFLAMRNDEDDLLGVHGTYGPHR